MPDLTALGNYGIAGIMLGIFIWLHIRALNRAEKSATDAAAACVDRDQIMTLRVQKLEDEQRTTVADLTRDVIEALRDNKHVMRAVVKQNGGDETALIHRDRDRRRRDDDETR